VKHPIETEYDELYKNILSLIRKRSARTQRRILCIFVSRFELVIACSFPTDNRFSKTMAILWTEEDLTAAKTMIDSLLSESEDNCKICGDIARVNVNCSAHAIIEIVQQVYFIPNYQPHLDNILSNCYMAIDRFFSNDDSEVQHCSELIAEMRWQQRFLQLYYGND
jgi:hypothetical protein